MITRRAMLAASAAAVAAPLAPYPALARGQPTKVPGLARFKIGDITITALSDGYLDMDLSVFPRTPTTDGFAALALSRQLRPIRAAVNAYLVDTAEKRVLIDAGGGAAGASAYPTIGRLGANLEAAGVATSSIDAVIATHLHIDHVGGLLAADKTAAFPNAELIAAEPELAFWTDPGLIARAPADFKPFIEGAQASIAPYTKRITRIPDEKEIVPGLTLTPAYGHTPGHCALRIASGGKQALMWGDVIHSPVLQFTRPEWTIAFDTDQDAAARTRARLLDMAAADKIPVIGSHLPFPGHGHVHKQGAGYGYEQAEWSYD